MGPYAFCDSWPLERPPARTRDSCRQTNSTVSRRHPRSALAKKRKDRQIFANQELQHLREHPILAVARCFRLAPLTLSQFASHSAPFQTNSCERGAPPQGWGERSSPTPRSSTKGTSTQRSRIKARPWLRRQPPKESRSLGYFFENCNKPQSLHVLQNQWPMWHATPMQASVGCVRCKILGYSPQGAFQIATPRPPYHMDQ